MYLIWTSPLWLIAFINEKLPFLLEDIDHSDGFLKVLIVAGVKMRVILGAFKHLSPNSCDDVQADSFVNPYHLL